MGTKLPTRLMKTTVFRRIGLLHISEWSYEKKTARSWITENMKLKVNSMMWNARSPRRISPPQFMINNTMLTPKLITDQMAKKTLAATRVVTKGERSKQVSDASKTERSKWYKQVAMHRPTRLVKTTKRSSTAHTGVAGSHRS